jgi:lipoyl(octanoyl) transferase
MRKRGKKMTILDIAHARVRRQMSRPRLVVHRLGLVPYQQSSQLQDALVAMHLDFLHKARDSELASDAVPPPNRLLLLQHPAVFTLGKRADPRHLLMAREEAERKGITVTNSDRGGDITLHVPGQLVGYPIINLSHFRRDMRWYIHGLEDILSSAAKDLGVPSAHGHVPGRAGVWVSDDRKLASIGVRVSRWISKHGFAINCDSDLSLFKSMIPCGLNGAAMTSITQETGRHVGVRQTEDAVIRHFGQYFGAEMVEAPLDLSSLLMAPE